METILQSHQASTVGFNIKGHVITKYVLIANRIRASQGLHHTPRWIKPRLFRTPHCVLKVLFLKCKLKVCVLTCLTSFDE